MRMKVISPSSSTYHKGEFMHTDYFNAAGQQVPSVTTVLKIMNKIKPTLGHWFTN